jgi:hypothetical protein
MSRWMLELSEKERERRAKVAAFMKAAPGFLDALVKKLKSDVDAYGQQFPDEHLEITPELNDGRIQIINASIRIVAIVSLNAITQRVACSFQNVGLASNWEAALDVPSDGSSLHSMGIGQDSSLEILARKILIPVLFPGLLSNPSALKYLNS